MQKNKHKDLQDCHEIKALLDTGHSHSKIDEIIGIHKAIIPRELSRNVATRGRYANENDPSRPSVRPTSNITVNQIIFTSKKS